MDRSTWWKSLSTDVRGKMLRDLRPNRITEKDIAAREWQALPRWAKKGLKEKRLKNETAPTAPAWWLCRLRRIADFYPEARTSTLSAIRLPTGRAAVKDVKGWYIEDDLMRAPLISHCLDRRE